MDFFLVISKIQFKSCVPCIRRYCKAMHYNINSLSHTYNLLSYKDFYILYCYNALLANRTAKYEQM